MSVAQRFFGGPIEFVAAQFEFLDRMWSGSERSRALLLGIPSLVIAVLGLAALALAQFGLKDRLEQRYVASVDEVSGKKTLLLGELMDELKAKQTSEGGAAVIASDDPGAERLEQLQDEEHIYLKKLISMNPDQPEYRFRLGQSYLRTNPKHGISILESLAPVDEAGYAKAHRWLARYYASLPATSNLAASANAGLALKHANHCLTRDKNDMTAKLIKSQVLYARGDLNQAYEIFLELFDETPAFYSPLITINKKLGREDQNESILEKALIQYKKILTTRELDEKKWVAVWENMVVCYTELGNYSDAEEILQDEIDLMKSVVEGNQEIQSARIAVGRELAATRRIFLQQLLSNIYLKWGTDLWMATDAVDDNRRQSLAMFEKAYLNNRRNALAKRWLTKIGLLDDQELAAAALEIYDPLEEGRRDARSVPALVLNELGTDALQQKKYKLAIKYYELARNDSPRDPMVLNNLSYAWLVGEETDPARALQLVDEGLKYLAGIPNAADYESNFLDTRGTALMQMERYSEALATFEQARSKRRKNVKLLENIVVCYEKLGLDPTSYKNEIERLQRAGMGG